MHGKMENGEQVGWGMEGQVRVSREVGKNQLVLQVQM